MTTKWPLLTIAECAADEPYATQIGPFGKALTAREYVDRGIPVLRGVNVNSGRFHDDDYVFISEEKADELAKYESFPGDVLLVHKGTLGQIGLMPNCRRYPRYIMGNSMLRVRCNPDVLLPEFLYYWLSSPGGQHYLFSRVSQVGVPQIQTPLKTLREAKLRVPSISEQRSITGVLSSLDDKIELNRRMSETLEEISATYFKTWLQDSGIGQGPVEGTLADIIEFDPPERLRRGTEAPYLGLAQIPNSGMIHEAPDTRAYTSGARFRNGDTLFARITPSLENGKTAIALGLGSNTIAWGSTELIVMRPKKPVPALVPYLISRDPAFRAHAVQNMSGTSGRQRVPREALMRYAFPASSHQDWQHLNRLLSPVVDAVWTRAQESRTLAELRDALLPKLISGELHIPEAEQVVSEVA